jgi:hypothetical protein
VSQKIEYFEEWQAVEDLVDDFQRQPLQLDNEGGCWSLQGPYLGFHDECGRQTNEYDMEGCSR